MASHALVLLACIVISGAQKLPGQGDVVSFKKGKSEMIANGVHGFKSKGKFYKIMGYRGSQRLAFQKFEEERDFAEDINEHKTSHEEKLLEEEDEFFSYEKQRKIAKKKGVDPQRVEIPKKAQQFEIQYGVGKTKRKRKSKWSKRLQQNQKRKRRRGRRKRFALKDEDRYWTNAIVPYVFTSDIKDEDIMGKLRAMRRLEYWTCVRFVPWTKDTREEYGLDHDNYLKHINKDGCWSVLGNTKGNGQKISCCSDSACLHELGHSLGLQHEQKSPLHDEYIRVNDENIIKERLGEYEEDIKGDGKTFGYYDLGDQMHYKRFMFSKNSKPTMTLYDPQMEYLLLSSDPHNYYMFKEITQIHKCAEMHCADFKQDCGKDGYVAFIRGRCQCRCPEGFDPDNGCRTKYKGDSSLLKLKWPEESYSMLKPIDGCPTGFKEGIIKQAIRGTGTSDIYHLDSENGMIYFTHKFCTKPKTTEQEATAQWGRGQYCILSYGGSCPDGFKDGVVGFDNMQKPEVLKHPIPDSQHDKNLVLHVCCREDGSWKDPLILPTKEAFVLFQKGDECQEVKDMMSSSEWFLVDNDFTGLDKIEGLVPEIEVIRASKYYIGICYYWPINYNCGGVIELTDSRREITISSPNFPSNYNIRQQCHWSIKSPVGSHVELDFQSFDIELREDDSCGDSLEVRTGLPGQLGINYCGDTFKPTVMSEQNYLGLIFTSGPEVTKRGFKAKLSVIRPSDMCFSEKGYDYRGMTNVSRTFRPCLPWSEVQHCPHHTFKSQDLDHGLDENYCRNPGSGLRPWCYIHKDECLREYCDACHFGLCYDKFYDCYQLQQTNAQFCSSSNHSAKFGCRKTCGFCAKRHSKAVSTVRCRTPEDIPDAAPIKPLKSKYKVGENVTYKCKTGHEKEDRVCLSDGTWSGGGFICGRCPRGWVPLKKKCYKYFDVNENKTGANGLCEGHSAVVTSAKDPDELDFLLSLRKGVNLFWLGMDRLSIRKRHLWQEDDSAVTWTKWKKGKTNNCAFVDKNGLWVGTSCNAAKYIAVICKFSPSERMICADAHPNCARILEREQSACMAYPEFSWHLCPQSCAVCKRGPEIKCARPVDGQNTVELTGKREVTVGRMFEYRCKKGYIHSEGNLRRVCLKSGKLSGDIPKCISEHSIPTANNAIELRQWRQDGRDGTAYVGLNDAQRIPKNGLLVRWMFYSIYDGEVALQVWRKLPGSGRKIKLKLIGQTVVSNTKDHRVHTVSLAPKSHQILVKEGDYIGFFLPTENKGGMTFDKCNSDIDGAYYGHQYSANGENANNWRLGGSYLFSKDKMSCKKVSLTAYVL